MSIEQGGAAPTEMLSAILQNPEIMGKLKDLLQDTQQNTQQDTQQDPQQAAAPLPVSADTAADGLASVLGNPALMAKLPQVMAMLKPMLSDSAPSPQSPKAPSPEERRAALLLALKPFLATERQQAVETMLQISRLGTVLRQLK